MIRFADNQNGYREFIQKVDIFSKQHRLYNTILEEKKRSSKMGRYENDNTTKVSENQP